MKFFQFISFYAFFVCSSSFNFFNYYYRKVFALLSAIGNAIFFDVLVVKLLAIFSAIFYAA
jgi:hypothetical protein